MLSDIFSNIIHLLKNILFLPHWLRLLKKSSQEHGEQGDLFEYASREEKMEQEREQKEEESEKRLSANSTEILTGHRASQHKGNSRLSVWMIICFLLLLCSFTGGYILGKKNVVNKIERRAFIYPYNKIKRLTYIKGLHSGRLYLARGASQNEEDPHYDPFGNDGPYLELDKVRRIDFFKPEKKEKEKKLNRPLRKDEKRFLGKYRIHVSEHRGLFYIYKSSSGRLGASVRFTNWGTQRMEFLRNVRVWKNMIYFKRYCKGKLCVKIGTTKSINQTFKGKLDKEKKSIIGTYTGSQSGSRWKARRFF